MHCQFEGLTRHYKMERQNPAEIVTWVLLNNQAIICSIPTIKTLEQGVKYGQT